jgi:hypothetical protein
MNGCGGFPNVKDCARLILGQAHASGVGNPATVPVFAAMALQVPVGKHWVVSRATLFSPQESFAGTGNISGIYIINPANVPLNSDAPIFLPGATPVPDLIAFLASIQAVRVSSPIESANVSGLIGMAMLSQDYIIVPSGAMLAGIAFLTIAIQEDLFLNFEYLQRDNDEC